MNNVNSICSLTHSQQQISVDQDPKTRSTDNQTPARALGGRPVSHPGQDPPPAFSSVQSGVLLFGNPFCPLAPRRRPRAVPSPPAGLAPVCSGPGEPTLLSRPRRPLAPGVHHGSRSQTPAPSASAPERHTSHGTDLKLCDPQPGPQPGGVHGPAEPRPTHGPLSEKHRLGSASHGDFGLFVAAAKAADTPRGDGWAPRPGRRRASKPRSDHGAGCAERGLRALQTDTWPVGKFLCYHMLMPNFTRVRNT